MERKEGNAIEERKDVRKEGKREKESREEVKTEAMEFLGKETQRNSRKIKVGKE